MSSEDGVRRLSLHPIHLEVELEAVMLGVLLQDIVQSRLHDPASGFLGVCHRDPHDGSTAEGGRSEYGQPRLQLPLVSDLSSYLLGHSSSSSSFPPAPI